MSWFKPKSFLGVDIGAQGIKLVELKREKNRPVLFTYGYTSESQNIHDLFSGQDFNKIISSSTQSSVDVRGARDMMSDEVDHYAAIIKSICREAKTISTHATVSLPVSAVFHAVVTLPAVKSDELDHLIRVEMKKLLPYPLEEAVLDYEILPKVPDARTVHVVVNTVSKKLVAFYTAIFQKAGLKLLALEPESTALSRSLIGRDTALSMIVDIGAQRTNFFIINDTHTITHQSVETGGDKINELLQKFWNIDKEFVEQMKYDVFYRLMNSSDQTILSKESFFDITSSVLDPIVKEIEYSFSLFLEQGNNQGKRPEKIIVTGGAGIFPYLTSFLAEKFTMKCYVGDPWGRVVYQDGLKSLLAQVGPRMSVAVGLALRGVV